MLTDVTDRLDLHPDPQHAPGTQLVALVIRLWGLRTHWQGWSADNWQKLWPEKAREDIHARCEV